MKAFIKKPRLLTIVCLMLALILSACNGKTNQTTSDNSTTNNKSEIDSSILTPSEEMIDTTKFKSESPWNIHFAQYNAGLPILSHWRDRMIDEAKRDKRINLTVTNGQANPGKFVSDIEDAISKKVDLIIIQAGDGQVPVPAVESAIKAGIPVVAMQKSINTDQVTATFIGNDTVHGKMQAEAMVNELKKRNGAPKGEIIIINGIPAASITVEMNEGFKQVISQYPDIKIVFDQPADFRRDQGVKVLENAMMSNPDAQGVWFIGADVGPGLAYAIQQAGKEKQMFVLGASGYMEELKLLINKEVVAYDLVLPDCVLPALNGAIDILQGKSVPKKTLVLGKELTSKNASDFYNSKILAVRWP